jgi:hypothetical protein
MSLGDDGPYFSTRADAVCGEMRLMKILCVILVAVLTVVACSAAVTKGPSERCATGTECASGACLDLAVIDPDGGACHSAGTVCSKPCKADPDCASLGAKYKCFDGCGPAKFCGATP